MVTCLPSFFSFAGGPLGAMAHHFSRTHAVLFIFLIPSWRSSRCQWSPVRSGGWSSQVRRIELTGRRSADAFNLLYIFPATREPWARNPDKTMRHVRIFFSGSPDTETVILYSQLTSFKDRDAFQVLFFPLFFIGGTPGLGGTYIMAVCVAKSVYLHVPYVHAAERLRSRTNSTNSSVYPSFECEAPSRLQSNWV